MIDVHCHIDQFKKPFEIAQRAEREGIITIGVTSLPEHFELGYSHLTSFKRVRLALGYHPMLARNQEFNESLFKTLSKKTSYIGEIGLDFSEKDASKREAQVDILQRIFKIIRDRPRFISLHSKRAEKKLYELLIENNIKKAVFHWYSGPLNLIDKIIEEQHYFSINPSMINSQNGQKIIKRIPQYRILTETDGPYVKINGKPAEPGSVRHVLSYLQKLWQRSDDDVANQIQSNFRSLIQHIR